MSKVRFELNRNGVRELMQSNEMQQILRSKAEQVKSAAGEDYEVTSYVGKNRANASVKVTSNAAYKDNLEHNTLLKALGQAKG